MVKKSLLIRILFLFNRLFVFIGSVLLGFQVALADDLEVFVPGTCAAASTPNYRFIFIVDNSGSMSDLEFQQSQDTVNATIERVLNVVPTAKVAVVQFGSNPSASHDYQVTVPFTNDRAVATGWVRAYGNNGAVDPTFIQDHIPGSLAKIRRDKAYEPGGALDITGGDDVQFVIFTDAERDNGSAINAGCCSSLVADGTRDFDPTTVYSMFGEYDALKDGRVLPGGLKAQFTVLHVAYNDKARLAAAAIASLGGSYTGEVEANRRDPDGSEVTPRRYISGLFQASDTTKIVSLIDEVIQEIYIPPDIEAESFSGLAVDVSDTNSWSTDDRTFISLFKPSNNRAWVGNLKGYFLGKDGLEDTNGRPATVSTPEGVQFAENAQSFWSATPDGNVTENGGANEQFLATRKLVSNVGGSKVLTAADNEIRSDNINIRNADLGAGSDAERVKSIDWLHASPMGDPLHTKPVLVRYTDRTLVYTMTNQGLLHAIDATTPVVRGDQTGGEELWAFMPKELLQNLPLLSGAPMPGEHVYGLDGGMTRWHDDTNRDGIVNGSESVVLIIGMRRGGRNYYAVDITRPTAPVLKWQITGGVTPGFEELQQTWSRAVLTTLRASGSEKTVLIFGGGYDVADDTNTTRTPSSGNRVFIVDADTGRLLWSVGAGSADYSVADMKYAIPSDISAIDLNSNGYTDRLYFGDMGGQIWRIVFDEKVDADNKPTVNFSSSPAVHRVADFGATDRIQFFYPPALALLNSHGDVDLTIAMGSGNRASPLETLVRNWIFMIREPLDTPLTRTLSISDLYDATDNLVSQASDKAAERDLLESADGWKMRLGPGEKSLATPSVFENKIRFTSFQPGSVDTTAGCVVTPSTSRYYVMNLRDATPASDQGVDESGLTKEDRSTEISSIGIPSSPVLTFPSDGAKVDVYVDNQMVGSIDQIVHRMFWKQVTIEP